MGAALRGVLGQAGAFLLQTLPGRRPGGRFNAGSVPAGTAESGTHGEFCPGQCKAWLFAAARNLYCDQVRRAVKEESLLALLDPDDVETPDETAEAALGTVDLDSLLGTLDPLDKMLFTLRYEEGYNASELGRKFELPPGTVRTRLGKVRHLLKQKLLEE